MITDAIDRHEVTFAHARRAALEWFLALEGVRFTHAWGASSVSLGTTCR